MTLFAHAEVGENIVEDLLWGDQTVASDFSKIGKHKAKVFWEEVAADILVQAFNDLRQIFMGAQKGLVMTGAADDDIRLGEGGDVGGFVDGGFEGVEALAVLGGDF